MRSSRLRRAARGVLATVLLMSIAVPAGAISPPDDSTKPSDEERTKLADVAKPAEPEVPEKTWKVDSRGAFSDAIPIEVPAFRALAPNLTLSYRSSGGNSVTGTGWSLSGVADVERAGTGHGAPKYDASDIYLLDGEELVPCAAGSVSPSCTTGGTHSTKNESYVRVALTGTGAAARWTVTDKDGTKRVFAPTHSVGTDLVFRWGPSEVTDTLGKTATYTWVSDRFGCCEDSLDSITYNGSTVKLHYETRPDNDQRAIGNGALATTRSRLKTIDVSVGSNRLRAYKLSYTVSTATKRSMLASVQQFGRDAVLDATGTVTGGTSLPPMTAGYQTAATAFVSGTTSSLGNKSDTRYLPMDINGDGKSDMLELYPGWTTFERHTWLSDGTGFTLASNDVAGIPIKADTRFMTADANADGKSDLIEIYPNGFNWGRRLWLSNGTGFALASTANSVGNNSADAHFLTMDVNGDGRADMIELYRCGIFPVNYCRATSLSNGTAFTKVSDEPGIGFGADHQFYPADVNGDGKTDLVEVYPAGFGAGGRHIWLSNGTGFVSGAIDTAMQFVASDGEGSGSRFITMDVNGDNKADMVELYPFLGMYTRRTWISTGYSYVLGSSDAVMPYAQNARQLVADLNADGRSDLIALAPYGLSTRRQIWFSTGAGFAAGPLDTGIGQFSCSKGKCTSEFLEMDVNGDGLDEMTEIFNQNFGTSKGRHVWNIGGAVPDLLSTSTNSSGATTAVTYTPSSAYTNTNNPPLVQTASKVTVGDGRGATAAISYSFSGGAYDRQEQESLGFRTLRETAPCITGETACPYTDTWVRQDLAALGEPERRERRTGSGTLLGATIQEFTVDNATLPRTALPTGTWENIYTGDGLTCPGVDCKRKYTARQYNAYGEVVQEIEHGDYEATGDERTTATTFVPNTTAYLVNKSAAERKYQGVGTAGTKLGETLAYYDNATTWNQAPTKGLATKAGQWRSATDTYAESRKEYDEWGNLTAEINPLGARTELGWDPTYHSYQTTEKNALAHQVAATWDPVCGQPTQVRNPDNQLTTVSYDALCRRAEMTEPGGKFERYTWVDFGNGGTQYEQTERPAADGTSSPQWSRRYFDGLQRTWRTVAKGPDAATGDIYVDSTYNTRGQVAAKTAEYYWVSGQPQPTTHPTLTSYDALDRMTKETMPGGAVRTKSYGPWVTTETDERGNATTERVNAYDKRISSAQLVGGATRTATYAYDGNDNLIRSTDPDGNAIVYTRDSAGNATKIVDPDNGTTTYEWDAAGRVVAQTDAKGQRTTFGYDVLDRKTSQVSKAGTASAVTATWRYDEARAGFFNTGQATTMTDSAGTRTSDYDAAGRAIKTVRTISGTAYTFQYGFDAGDRPLWTTYPDGFTVGTSAAPLRYDAAGRLIAVPGFVNAARYTAAGELTRLENSNGTVTTRGFDDQRGWLNSIVTKLGSTTIQDNTFTRDALGNVTQVNSPFAGESSTYTYDEAEQLTKATASTGNHTLAYDGTGNIAANSELGAYTYSSAKPHAVTVAGANTYGYDAAGLMTSGAGRTLTWDGENRLASVIKGGVTTTFTYDGEGARLQTVEGGTTRRYLGDDYEVDATAGTATKYISVAGKLVARADGGTKYWVHTDQQGSVQAVTDASGNEVHRKKYAAFGEVTSASGPLARESRGFTGQRADTTGLVYLHSRYYDPELGRLVSPNPVVDGEDTIGLNRYAYAANDPINKSDETGLDCEKGGKKCDRGNWKNYRQQNTGWSCGPAAVRVALSAQSVYFDDESDLYEGLNTDEDGTDTIANDVVPFLNGQLRSRAYQAYEIGTDANGEATADDVELLRQRIQTSLNANRPIVANVTIGTAYDTQGHGHQYGGHYVAVVGYDDSGSLAHVYDSADVYGVNEYWMSTKNLATWIAGKGYAGQ
jgi:RHS repeat-associated protein